MASILWRRSDLASLKCSCQHPWKGRSLNLPIDPDLQEEHSHHRPSLTTVALIALGGSIGALLRWLVGQWFPTAGRSDWPLSTLFINITGSALLALIVVKAQRSWIRPLLGTGLLGGFTTFSAVMSQVRWLTTDDGNLLVSAVYLGMTVVGSVGAVLIVFRVFRR